MSSVSRRAAYRTSVITATTKLQQADLGGLYAAPAFGAEQPQLATTASAWSALPMTVFAAVCETYKSSTRLW